MNEKKSFTNVILALLIIIVLIVIIYIILHLNFRGTEEILFTDEYMLVNVDEIKMMPFIISEDNDLELVFVSEDEKIARIDSQGYVYGVAVGDTYVVVSYKDNKEYEKRLKVYVLDPNGSGEFVPTEETSNEDPTSIDKPPEEKNTDKPKTAKPICSLKVSKDGTVTATVKDAKKYGFSKSLSTNETEKHVKNISNKETRDYEGWKYYKITYYVEGEDNLKGSCSIVVIEKCNGGSCTYEAFN